MKTLVYFNSKSVVIWALNKKHYFKEFQKIYGLIQNRKRVPFCYISARIIY